jgi:hypothetical protein
LSCILQAVKCHAVSNAKKVVAKPMPMYAIFSNILSILYLKDIRLLENILSK